jgi:hypothetical protein
LPSLADQRELHYETLFAGELPYQPLSDEATVGIAALARTTFRGGQRPVALKEHLANLPDLVSDYLDIHDELGRYSEDPSVAVFCFVDEEDRLEVTGIVTEVIEQWERACHRLGREPLITHDETGYGLIIETASAVSRAFMALAATGVDISSERDRRAVSKLITSWGPEFATQWLNGELLTQWMAHNQITEPEDIQFWNEFVTPGLLVEKLHTNIANPLDALDRIKYNLETYLTDTKIAKYLGWSVQETAEFMTPSTRKQFAVKYIGNPVKGLEQLKHNYETVLSDQALAENLGWPVEKVNETLNPYMRKMIALQNPKNTLEVARQVAYNIDVLLTDKRIANHLGWPVEQVRHVFNPTERKHFALHYRSNPLAACKLWVEGEIQTTGRYSPSRKS